MTNETALRIIAEFMGWEIEKNKGVMFFVIERSQRGVAEVRRVLSFDTMRMVLDEFKDVDINPANSEDYYTHTKICYNIIQILGWGTPTDCALRLAEAIEWWKSVKS